MTTPVFTATAHANPRRMMPEEKHDHAMEMLACAHLFNHDMFNRVCAATSGQCRYGTGDGDGEIYALRCAMREGG